ncbi:MAG: hypothetical protein H0V66_15195 [Bdellovibrionales bacterium]|nr:hypothetical protein [Bdellovibrionales bacterium]
MKIFAIFFLLLSFGANALVDQQCSTKQLDDQDATPMWGRYAESMKSCLPRHKTLLGTYNHQLKLQIGKLIRGIGLEMRIGSDAKTLKKYKQLLVDLVAKSAYAANLYHQLAAIDPENMCVPFSFKTVPVDDKAFSLALKNAEATAQANGFTSMLSETFQSELIEETFVTIVNGVLDYDGKAVLNVTANGVVKGIVKGAVKGAILSILLEPLYGQTTLKEYDWIEVIGKNPDLMLNPQWMSQAGVGTSNNAFYQWEVHCRAWTIYPEHMKKLDARVKKKPAKDFQGRVLSIEREQNNFRNKDQLESPDGRPFYTQPSESTRVQEPLVPAPTLPDWAR